MDEGAKIYGLCLERLKYQIRNAQQKLEKRSSGRERILLESYNTGEIEEIVDILELYDIEEHTPGLLKEKLDDLAYTVSVLARETLLFGYTDKGHLGLYFVPGRLSDRYEAGALVSEEMAASVR